MKSTQCDRVLGVLSTRYRITHSELSAKLNHKILNITARISDLRKLGHVITTVRPGEIDPYKQLNHTKYNQICYMGKK
jgi:hypothetical protein